MSASREELVSGTEDILKNEVRVMLSPEDYQKSVCECVCECVRGKYGCLYAMRPLAIIQEHEFRPLILSFFVGGAGEGVPQEREVERRREVCEWEG